jgi:hypothetical protein
MKREVKLLLIPGLRVTGGRMVALPALRIFYRPLRHGERGIDPFALFRYLPIYTIFAGATGFAIGWIVGRNIRCAGVTFSCAAVSASLARSD